MKALISPNEKFNLTWVSSWVLKDGQWVPIFSEIIDCFRVAEIIEQPFEVASPLFWVDCPNDCVADQWYYKDNQVFIKPLDELAPEQN
jgi:hypothetical protein